MNKWTRRAFVTTGVITGGVLAIGVGIRPGKRTKKVADFIANKNESVLNVWLKISPDNTVTAIVPHAEMGQGVHTTLAMMLADEMDADWNQVRVMEAPAKKEYANYALAKGYLMGDTDFPSFMIDTLDGFFLTAAKTMSLQITGGSTSVKTTGIFGMRVAGAAAKSMLLQAASEIWQVPVKELQAIKSHILHPSTNRSAPFSDFSLAAADIEIPPKPQLKSEKEFTIMGTSPPKIDIPSKTDGSANFGIDIHLPNMKYATVKAAPVFGAKVKSIDESSIQNMPGIRKIVNLGDAVAVIADGYWQAKQGLKKLSIEFTKSGYENVDQNAIFLQFEKAMDKAKKNNTNKIDFKTGNANIAMQQSNHSIEAEYRAPYLAHATMEPMNCTAWVHDDQCELWLGTQNPLGFAAEVASALSLDVDNILLHNQYLGGGFGRRAFSDFAIQASLVAQEVHYPVKLIWSREEDMQHDHYRQANISRFKASFDKKGNPTAWINQFVDKHDPIEAPYIPYAIDNQLIHYADSKTHVPWGFWRSVDHSLHAFFTESFIDEMAHDVNKDAYEFRRDLLKNKKHFIDVLDLAAEKSKWYEPLPKNWGRGIAIHKSFGTIVAQVVDVEIINKKALVHKVTCAVDCGFAIHPEGLKSQMESGIVYGLTAALYSNISIQNGAVVQSNFHDYEMLRMNESPEINTYIINGGGKIGGAGEPGTPAIAPALTNAIFNATGLRIRELPIKHHDLTFREYSINDVV